jgi:hypothetical protein
VVRERADRGLLIRVSVVVAIGFRGALREMTSARRAARVDVASMLKDV